MTASHQKVSYTIHKGFVKCVQGFPDYFTLVGLGKQSTKVRSGSRNMTLNDRYESATSLQSPDHVSK